MIPARYILVMLTVEMVVFARSQNDYEENDVYRVSVNKYYTLFSSNVNVNFSLPSNISNTDYPLILQLLRFTNNASQSLEFITVPRDTTSGALAFRCDSIQSSGRYTIRLTRNLTDTLAEAVFTSDWPSVTLALAKTQFTALAEDVEVRLLATGLCLNWSSFALQLCRLQQLSKRCDVVFKSIVKSLVVVLPCGVVQRPGNYVFQLISTGDTSSSDVITTSETVGFASNKLYVFFPVRMNDIYHCDEHLKVGFSRPRCPHIADKFLKDKIRLYRQHQQDMFHSVLVYIAEQRVVPSSDSVQFDCELFESINDVDVGYCLKYVTQSTDGAVIEQTSYCVSASFTGSPVDGGWSIWSSWSQCTDNCRDGIQTRHRTCDNPSPSNGGTYCSLGNMYETRHCQDECTTVTSTTTPRYNFLHSNDTQLTLNDVSECEYSTECHCLVHLTTRQSTVIISSITSNISSTDCPLSTQLWTVRLDPSLPPSASVELTIRLYRFDAQDRSTVLLVRAGESPLSDLLWSSHGQPSGQVQYVINTRGALTFYFTAPTENHQHFTAIINADDAVVDVTAPGAIIEDPYIDFGLFKVNKLLGLGIVMTCALFIMVACTIACHDRICVRRRRRVKTSPVKDKQSLSPMKQQQRSWQQPQPQSQQGTPLNPLTQRRHNNAWNYNSALYQQHHVIAAHPYYDDDSTSSDSCDQYGDYPYYKRRKERRPAATKQHYQRSTPPAQNDVSRHQSPGQHHRATPSHVNDVYQHQSPGQRQNSTPQRNVVYRSPEQYQATTPSQHNDSHFQTLGKHPHSTPQHNAIYLSPAVLRLFDAQFSQPVLIGQRPSHGTSNLPMSPPSHRGNRHARKTINKHSKRIKKKHKKRAVSDNQRTTAVANACPSTSSLMPGDTAASKALITLTKYRPHTVSMTHDHEVLPLIADAGAATASLMPGDTVTALPVTADPSDLLNEMVSNCSCSRPVNINEEIDLQVNDATC